MCVCLVLVYVCVVTVCVCVYVRACVCVKPLFCVKLDQTSRVFKDQLLEAQVTSHNLIFRLAENFHPHFNTCLIHNCRSAWDFDARPQNEKLVTNEPCCKVTPQPEELAFPDVTWMAGCCSFQVDLTLQ